MKKPDLPYLVRKAIFFSLYEEVPDFAGPMQRCAEGSVVPSINGSHEELLVKRRRLFGCEGTCV